MPVLGVAGDVLPRTRRKGANKHHGRHKKKLFPSERQKRKAARKRAIQSAKVLVRSVARPPRGGRLCDFQLYALELEGGFYYVGMTSYPDVNTRLDEHVMGGKRGAKWTKEHVPRRVIETRQVGRIWDSEAAKLENEMTIEYMLKYGTELVRGGDMCNLDHDIVNAKFRAHISRRLNTIQVKS